MNESNFWGRSWRIRDTDLPLVLLPGPSQSSSMTPFCSALRSALVTTQQGQSQRHQLQPLERTVCPPSLCVHVQLGLFMAPLQTVAGQAPLSMDFFGQEDWSTLPFPTPGDIPDPGFEPTSFASSMLAGRFFTTSATWEAPPPFPNFV